MNEGGKEMNYLVESIRVVGHVLGIFVGRGLTPTTDDVVVKYPSLHYYF